jgi:tellurite resistance protein TehA-like permease
VQGPGPDAAPAAGALRHVAGLSQHLSAAGLSQHLSAGGLAQHAGGLWQRALATQPLPPPGLALAAVASPRLWRAARIVVTIVHESGHALAALVTGRRLAGIRLYRNTAGVTESAGKATGPGIVLTAAAGYPAPSLLGLGAAALLAVGHLTAMLLLSLVLLAGLLIAIRNAYGMLAVLVTGGAIAAVSLLAAPEVQAGFGYVMAWFLLLGGVRPVIELQRERRLGGPRRTDADQLARLTRLPGAVWVGIFGIFALAALAVSARWLVG